MVSLVLVWAVLLAHWRSSPDRRLLDGQQHDAVGTVRPLRLLDVYPPPRGETGLFRRPISDRTDPVGDACGTRRVLDSSELVWSGVPTAMDFAVCSEGGAGSQPGPTPAA